MTFEWKGVYPALLTPFNNDDSIDIEMFLKNLDAQIDAGVHGVIIGGSLGEASTITLAEKESLIKVAVEHSKKQYPVIMNIAESTTKEAIHQAKLAEQWGVSALMLLPPMRYKSSDEETVTYFKAVANSTILPVLIYNNPVDYKIEVTLAMFDSLIECKNITAVKESTRDVTNVTRLKNKFGDRIKILCGVDTLAVEELCLGADGLVAGLVDAFPKETMAIYNLIRQNKIKEAVAIYRWFMPLLELDIHPKLVQYIKLAAMQEGISTENVRAPRLKLVGEEREQILEIINDAISTRPQL